MTKLLLIELTFIVLARTEAASGSDLGSISNEEIRKLPMIGDVNLFFKRAEEDDDPDTELEIECEVMIAGLYRKRTPMESLFTPWFNRA